jgi:hypothetical protein
MADKKKLKKSEFVGMCMDLAERLTRSEHNLREEQHLSHQHWMFRNGAMAMASSLLKEQYEIVEG